MSLLDLPKITWYHTVLFQQIKKTSRGTLDKDNGSYDQSGDTTNTY